MMNPEVRQTFRMIPIIATALAWGYFLANLILWATVVTLK